MTARWKKRGLVFDPRAWPRWWLAEFAQAPCTLVFGDFVRTHWGQPDPAAIAAASARQAAFEQAHAIVAGRIRALLALPEALWNEPAALKAALDAIGASPEAAGAGT